MCVLPVGTMAKSSGSEGESSFIRVTLLTSFHFVSRPVLNYGVLFRLVLNVIPLLNFAPRRETNRLARL